MNQKLRTMCNIVCVSIVILLALFDGIEKKSLIFLILIPIVINMFLRGRQYIKENDEKRDLFKAVLYKYTGLIYVLGIIMIWILKDLNSSNILLLIYLIPGIVVVLIPMFKRVY